MMELWALVLVLACLMVLKYLRWLWRCRHYPPGPFPWPLIGSTWWTGLNLHKDTLMKLAKQYGSLSTLWIAQYPIVILSGYQTVKEGLIGHSEELSGRPVTNLLKIAFKRKGIVLSNGRVWKQQRRFGVGVMRQLGLGKKGMESQIQVETHRLVEVFASAKGQPFDPLLPITNSVSSLICVLAFGYRFSLEDKEFQEMIDAVDFLLKFGCTMCHTLFPSIFIHLPGPHQKALSFSQLVLSFARKEIEKHKEQTRHEPQDFIDFYLLQIEKNNPSSSFNEENLSETILELFIAGTETTATTLHWALLLMVAHPDVQEMEDVLGSSHSICYQDRKKLPYTNAVIHEIQRANYALPLGIPRRSIKDVHMNGFIIPKDTIVVTDLRSVLLDPKQWETPEQFNPQHFLDKDGNFVAREEFLPFGAGARVCLGEQMARMEIFLFLTHLLRNFRFQLPEGVTKINQEPVMGMTFHPVPYKVCAIPRSSSS
uniref:Cytochrome P450 n=1 Tax=Varanus komodoensis TaxID=61221 RepID=A0A8D2IGN7_VARKO